MPTRCGASGNRWAKAQLRIGDLDRMKALLGAVAASCFLAVGILLLSWTTYFAELNFTAYDFTLRLAGSVPPKSPTVIVGLDEESLRIGGWPWPREKFPHLSADREAG